MNYQKIYDNLIQSAQLRPDISFLNGYTERHHILPKSMGGSDDASNLVKLTAREHYVAHWLLWRIHRNKQMCNAFMFMSNAISRNKNAYYSSRGYQAAKNAMSETRKGQPSWNKGKKHSLETRKIIKEKRALQKICHSEETRQKISESHKGKKLSDETRQKISEVQKGRSLKEETKRKVSLALKGKPKPPRSKEHIEKIAAAHRGRPSNKKGAIFFYRYSLEMMKELYELYSTGNYSRKEMKEKFDLVNDATVNSLIKRYKKLTNGTE